MAVTRGLLWRRQHPQVCPTCGEYLRSKRSLTNHLKSQCKKVPSTKGPKESFVNEMFKKDSEAKEAMQDMAPDDAFSYRTNLDKRVCKIKNCFAELRVRKARRLCFVEGKWDVIFGYVVLGTLYHNPELHYNLPAKKKGYCNLLHEDHKIICETFSSKLEATSKATFLLPLHKTETVTKRSTVIYKCSCHSSCGARLRVIEKNPVILRGCIKHTNY